MAWLGLLILGASLLAGNALDDVVAGTFYCNFEVDLCGLQNSPIGVPWTRQNKAYLLSEHIPNRPNEVAGDQWYLYLPLRHTSQVEEPGLAVARTNILAGGSAPVNQMADLCLSYWIYMTTDQENEFRISAAEPDGSVYRVLQRFMGNAAPTWRFKYIDFQQSNPFQLELYAMILPTSTSNFSQIAIDDIGLAPGKCPNAVVGNQISCNFEQGMCGYETENDDGGDNWYRTSKSTSPLGPTDVPQEDSTYHTENGYYAFFRIRRKTGSGIRSASLISVPEQVVGSHCISFHYQISRVTPGYYPITFMLKAIYDETQTSTIWSTSSAYGFRWVAAEAEFTVPEGINQLKPFKVEFLTSSLSNTEGYVALDDISFSTGKCLKTGDCTFDLNAENPDGYCGWEVVTGNQFQLNMIWAVGQPTGPVSTSGDYLYFRGGRGSGNMLKARALLASEQMVYDTSKCMTFQYYINKTGAAEIRIHQVQDIDQERILWADDGRVSEGDTSTDYNGWRLARVPLLSLNHANFIVTIEGIIRREISDQYIVGIDNVKFLQDPCTLAPPIAAPLPIEEVPEEHGASVCNFDNDDTNEDCGYITDEDATAQFHIRTGNTHDEYFSEHAPMFDRTTLEEYGRYLYFPPIKAERGTYARQISPEYKRENPADPRCLKFWYYFREGPGAGQLNVYARVNDTDNLVWTSAESTWWLNVAYEWSLASASIPAASTFRIIFEAMIMEDNGYLSAALDDITVSMTECKVMDCDFEEGFCSWHNYFDFFGTADLAWEFTNENLIPEVQNPAQPHGRFIFVPVESTTPAGHQAMLEHYEVMKSNEHVCLQFDYYITAVTTGTLALYWYDKEGEVVDYTKIWTTEQTRAFGAWQTGQALIQSNKAWNVMLVATARPNNSTIPAEKLQIVALDNIRHRIVSDAQTCPSLPVNSLVTTTTTPATTTVSSPHSNNSIVYMCTFDENLCGFETDPASTIEWQRLPEEWTVPNRPSAIRGNKFLYANFLNEEAVYRFGSITSPTIDVNANENQFFCIRFWVFMDSFSDNRLLVSLVDGPMQPLVLETFAGVVRPWTVKSINVRRNKNFQIRLFVQNALDLDRYEGVAVDEFIVENGKCSANEPTPTFEFCDFEEGPCKFSVGSTVDNFHWRITNGHDVETDSDAFIMSVKPTEDHTYNAPGGHFGFLYLGSNTDAWTGTGAQKADMKYSPIPALSGDQCVSFFYRLLKGSVKNGPELKVLMNAGGTQRTLFTSNIPHGRKWIAAKASVLSRGLDDTYDLDVTFSVNSAKGAKGAVAIDDFAVTPGACEHPGDCKFNTGNNGICDWQHLPLGDYATIQWTNRMPAGGPVSDSSYLFIEGGRPTGHLPGSRAVLYSEYLTWPLEQAMCMTFKFFSNASGAAAVRVHQVEDPSEWNPLWENYGRQEVNMSQGESVWHPAQIPLQKPKDGEEFLITIEGYIKREVDAVYFIAVEDVVFLNQACILMPMDSVPIPTVQPPTDDTANVCTFDDSDMCGWTHQSVGSRPYNWELLSGRDQGKDPNVPPFDHSTMESFGKFLYFNASAAPLAGTAITKPYTRQNANDPTCLRFWMYMQGHNPGELHISMQGQDFPEKEIYAIAGWDSRRWNQYMVQLPVGVKQFLLKIEGRDQLDFADGGISFDNLAVSPGECRQVDCNFEHGMCSWENYYDASGKQQYDFEYGTAKTLESEDDSVDRGVFVYLPVLRTTPRAAQSFLRHDSFVEGNVERNFCLHFDYLITGEQVGRLTLWHYWVNAENGYDYATVWSSRGEPEYGYWQKGQIYLDKNSSWTLMFEAVGNEQGELTSNRLHGIAVDNIQHELVSSADLCPQLPRPAPATTRRTTTLGTTTPRPTSGIGNPILQSCNFDKDECGWTVVSGSTIKWHRAHQTITSGDEAWVIPYRTDNIKNDYFLFAETTGRPNGNKMGSITAPLVQAQDQSLDYCLRFWAYVEAQENSEISIIRKDNGNRETVLERYQGEARPEWSAEHIPFQAKGPFQIMFRADAPRGADAFGVAAIDEYVLELGKCSNDQLPEHPGVFCDFEEDDCGYVNRGGGEIVSWTRTSREMLGTTSDLMLIDLTPSEDNTLSSIEGHYAFAYLGPKMETTTTAAATYSSRVHTLRGEQCVTFFYRHVRIPSSTSTAKLSVSATDGEREWTIFNSDMAHGKKWVGAKASFTPINKTADYPFTVSFIVSGFQKTRAAVALDDIAIVPENCQHVGDCSFNTGSVQLCMWQRHVSEESKMQWKNGLPNGGPAKDSGYIYFQGGPRSGNPIGSRALLYSPTMFYEDNLCMTFNYFMNSTGAAVVRVHLVEQVTGTGSYNPVWEDYGRDEANTTLGGNGWHHAQIPIPSNSVSDFLVLIEGVVRRETNVPYFMAIDDMVFLRGPCPLTPADALPIPTVTPSVEDVSEVCTFDDDIMNHPMCDWQHDTSQSLKWEMLTGYAGQTSANVPTIDHTTVEPMGNFLYANLTNVRVSSTASVVSRGYDRVKADGSALCKILVLHVWRSDWSSKCAWNLWGQPGIHGVLPRDILYGTLVMREYEVPLDIMSFKLKFDAFATTDTGQGGVAIDDIAVLPHNCIQVECNFEHGMCNWENYYDGTGNMVLDWLYGVSGMLPSADDAVNRGIFLYVPVRPSTPARQTALMRHDTLVLPGNTFSCFHFEFLITARNVGRITIWLYWLNQNNNYDYKQIWVNRGLNNIGKWQTGQFFIDRSERWTLMIEAMANDLNVTIPSGSHGIAVDNFKLEVVPDAQHCPTVPQDATITTPTPFTTTTTRPTTTAAPSSFECNFDAGHFCGWTQRDDTQYKFLLGQKGSTETFGPALGDDSETRDGKFIYIDAPSGTTGDEARLFSPTVNQRTPYCFRFFYNMNGNGMGQINVYTVRTDGPSFSTTWKPPKSFTGRNYGDQWIGAAWTITQSTVRQIVLEAVRGTYATSYIGIDSISLKNGACETEGNCDFSNGWCQFNPYAIQGMGHWDAPPTLYQAIVTAYMSNGESAIFRTDILPAQQKLCLRFKFMADAKAVLLVRSIEYPPEGSRPPAVTDIWRLEGSLELNSFAFIDARAPVTLDNKGTNPIQLSFEAHFLDLTDSTPGHHRTITVDDVFIDTAASCSYAPDYANPSVTTTAPSTTLDFTVETVQPSTEPPVETPVSKYNCNFDQRNLCLWTSKSGILWKVSNTQVSTASGPTTDHSGHGYFAYLDPASNIFTTSGRLESPYIEWSGSEERPSFYVFSFWYYMHGSAIHELRVNTQQRGSSLWENKWTLRGDKGKRWFLEQLVLPVGVEDFKVALEGVRKEDFFSDSNAYIAVDDIIFEAGKIPDQFDDTICDFDTNAFCGYAPESTVPAFMWAWRNGDDTAALNDTGPLYDKSQNSAYGHYMAISAKDASVGDSAKLFSTLHDPTTGVCVKFYYYRRSVQSFSGILDVYLLKNQEATESIWSDENMIGGDFWEPVMLEIASPAENWKIVWNAEVVSPDQPVVAIDHVVITEGLCPRNVIQCSFDEDTCEWYNGLSDDHVNWVLEYGPSQVQGTGPDSDALNDADGGYLLFEAVSADVEDTARMLSTPIDNEGHAALCFKFHYHMFGVDVGELLVIQKNLVETSEREIVRWQLFGNQQNQWHSAQVKIAPATREAPYQIVLQAKRNGLLGNIAVDEVDMSYVDNDADCKLKPEIAVPLPTTPPPTTLQPTQNPNGTCTFEQDTCGWNSDTLSGMKWKRTRAATQNLIGNGPAVDHTIQEGSGWYLVFDPRTGKEGDRARIQGGTLQAPACVQFYYHAAGQRVGTLNVRSHSSTGGEVVHWSRHSPDDGAVWQFGETTVSAHPMSHDGIYQIVFEAIRGKGSEDQIEGDIALDDITVLPTPCQETVSHCTFENGLCGFTHFPNEDGMTWRRVSISRTFNTSEPPNLAPLIDVTTGTKEGYFLMANRHNTALTSLAQIRSPVYDYTNALQANTDHCFRFYYAMQTRPRNSTDNLVVTYTPLQGAQQVFMEHLAGDQGWEWHMATHPIPRQTGAFSVMFTATIDDTATVFAVDDVSVTPGPCVHFLDCQFAGDSLCLWRNADAVPNANQIHWRAASPSQGISSGPPVDSSGAQNGWFALITSDAPSKPRDLAWLMSQTLPKDTSICLTFWFYMGSVDNQVNILRILSVDFGNEFYKKMLWRIETPVRSEWTAGQLEVDGVPWLRSLVFEAEVGSIRGLFVAIDNLVVLDHACTPNVLPEEASPSYNPPTPPPTTHNPLDFDVSCDFEGNNMCAWQNAADNLDQCTWTVQSSPVNVLQSVMTGPSSDHTLGDSTGHYLLFNSRFCNNATYPNVGFRGTALTTSKTVAGERNCLKFWYFMFGAPGMLTVQINSNSGDSWIEFMRNGNQGKRWIEARVNVQNVNDQPYWIVFEAMMGPSRFGDIALDDIRFDEGQCEAISNYQCDFEGKFFCGYRSVKEDGAGSFFWNHVKVMDIVPLGVDHTFISNHGHIAHADGRGARKGARTYLVSPPYIRIPNSPQCVTFWYKITPYPDGGRLAVHITRAASGNDFSSPKWSVTGSNIDQYTWEYGTVPVEIGEDFKVAFDARNDNGTAFQVDDINIIDDECPGLLACTFEDGLCGWSNGILDNIEWIVHRGDGVPNEVSGPSADALGNPYGHYIYIDNDYPNADDYDAAHLVSQRVVPKVSFYCFSFYYHMFIDGRSNASLDLSIVSGGQTSDSIFFRNEPGRNQWMREAIELSEGIDFGGDFALMFTGKVHGEKGKSDIALDEFSFSEGRCTDTGPHPVFMCDNDIMIEGWKQCDNRVDCTNGNDERNCGNCGFENDLCGYTVFQNSNYTWTRVPSGFAGAPVPTNTVEGSRYYMLADNKDGPDRSAAYLDSPIIRQTSKTCRLQFWTYVYSLEGDPGAMIVTLRSGDSDVTIAIFDHNTGVKNHWNLWIVDVGRHSGEFRIVFRARKGSETNGSIGVDEVIFKDCGFPERQASCGANEWQCPQSGACIIPTEFMCDFADDCGYYEDEQNCRQSHPFRCDFDDDFCDWTQDAGDNFDWLRTNYRTLSGYTGPIRDHTTGLRNGGFIYASSTFYNISSGWSGNRGRLLSRPLTFTNDCILRFYRHMYGNTMGALRVFRLGSSAELFIDNVGLGDKWVKSVVRIGGPAANIRVVLEAQLGGLASDIAVDDISFSGSCFNQPDVVTLPPTTTTTMAPTTTAPSTISTGSRSTATTASSSTTSSSTSTTSSTTRSSTQSPSSTVAPVSRSSTSAPPLPTTSAGSTTTHSQLTCPDRFCATSRVCLEQSAICDGKKDCEDGFDEANCPTASPASGLDPGAIAGIVIAVLAAVGAAGAGAYVVIYRRRKQNGTERSTLGYATFGALDGPADEDSDHVGNKVLHDIFSKDL
ncbi:LOW QUALITY PROTEIN: MAM and LDL-receptor class A domain-containing protein 2-like [Paramacrobiotus metropolitanus]|uniref:LOW QUALITY PROTEIN: MAM and LDL-receptor class A domain-containing protein 2-like n=1 Tax=Paramacrobiotus metropolitanus TaxID=2943436 RepID=UPI0024457C23|nr:LOW QUALITY PROTEIN: MAM and LDL-receptor class A domain-containing protein 2-like [Paramacrobiotus metropolitanus]